MAAGDQGLWEGVGDFLGNIGGAVRDVFVAREQTRLAQEQAATAARASSALETFTLEKWRIIAVAVVAGAALFIYLRR